MKATMEPIPFAGSMLRDYRHVCAFFNSPQEEYDTLLPFVRDGLERDERAYHVLPSQYRDEHLEQLRRAGIDVAAAQLRRQLEVATSEETYLHGGRFNKDAMLVRIEEALKSGATLGFPLTRLIAHAETVLWHPEDWSSINEWIEHETRLNDVLAALRRSGDLCVRRQPSQRQHRGRYSAHTPRCHHRRVITRESVLRAAEAVSASDPAAQRRATQAIPGMTRL